jgi:hypothetical protein
MKPKEFRAVFNKILAKTCFLVDPDYNFRFARNEIAGIKITGCRRIMDRMGSTDGLQ